MSSLNEYAPVFTDFTILITLVNAFVSPLLNVATTFLAILCGLLVNGFWMIISLITSNHSQNSFYLLVNGHFLQNGIELLDLHSVGSILPVLGSNVPWSSRHPTVLVLSTLQNDLNPISFFSHCSKYFEKRGANLANYKYPFAFASLRQAFKPLLLIFRIPAAETFSVTHLSSSVR